MASMACLMLRHNLFLVSPLHAEPTCMAHASQGGKQSLRSPDYPAGQNLLNLAKPDAGLLPCENRPLLATILNSGCLLKAAAQRPRLDCGL